LGLCIYTDAVTKIVCLQSKYIKPFYITAEVL